jgi:glycosyltransferase involved in cell wall biosynthesis
VARILVLGVKVPFTSGGQEVLVRSLIRELQARGHEADSVELPFNLPSREWLLHHGALWRSLDLTEFAGKKVDLVIGTKFPSYYAKHPRKSLWLVHQHRPIYDLYGGNYSDFTDSSEDEAIRQLLVESDHRAICECDVVTGISRNVVRRLKEYNGVEATTLYPPLPLAQHYRCGQSEDYILSVGRICGIKRVDVMLKALPTVHQFVKLKIVGQPDEPGIMDYLQNEVAKHHLSHRVEFLGRVTDEELVSLYARSLGVYYAPHDEDYGYVTLEALASGKPVVTALDSGGVLEFIENEVNGLIVAPTFDGIAGGFNRLIENKDWAAGLGKKGKAMIQEWGILESGWDKIIETLLRPIDEPNTASSSRQAAA